MYVRKGQIYKYHGKTYTVLEVREDQGTVVIANFTELRRFEIPRSRLESMVESREVRLRYCPSWNKKR